MNKILFGVIGVLMLSIAGVGIFDLSKLGNMSVVVPVANSPSSQTNALQPTSSKPSTPPSVAKASPPKQATTTPPKQAPGTFTMAQVATHNSELSCYTAINGSVYDVTNWINQHPGGAQAILSLCGTDGSAAFNAQHGGQRQPASELASFKIGTLI